MKIHCNDIEVLNFLVSKDRCDDSNWRNYWSRDVEKIGFSIDDTASDYYRPFIPGILLLHTCMCDFTIIYL